MTVTQQVERKSISHHSKVISVMMSLCNALIHKQVLRKVFKDITTWILNLFGFVFIKLCNSFFPTIIIHYASRMMDGYYVNSEVKSFNINWGICHEMKQVNAFIGINVIIHLKFLLRLCSRNVEFNVECA